MLAQLWVTSSATSTNSMKTTLKAQPTAQAREDFDKRRAWLAVNVGKAMYMSKTDAVEFLSGLLSELKRRKPRRGHGYAAVAEQVFLNHIAAATRCHTREKSPTW